MSVQHIFFLLGFLLLCSGIPPSSAAESSACLAVYKEGGAPAVFQSPRCPRWILSPDGLHRHRQIPNCQSAMLQGRRNYQEDRTVCALDTRIPFIGRTGVRYISVGIVAVFDGHNGAEASEMASKLLLDYFLLHAYFLIDGIYTPMFKGTTESLMYKDQVDVILELLNLDAEHASHNLYSERSKWILPRILDGTFHMQILRESLLRTIRDIDSTFSKEAFKKNFESGSTATVVLIADDQILVANAGDSKAILCSKSFYPPHESGGNLSKYSRRTRLKALSSSRKDNENFKLDTSYRPTYFRVKELTRDHHPDRDDERLRVEAAGGYVTEWADVSRVNGKLAVSRAIGDVLFKNYGVTSIPELTDWQPLSSNDTHLVVASDGIFEKLTTQEICNLLGDVSLCANLNTDYIYTMTQSLADCIVNTAFERGTIDNMAAVVVPLESTGTSGTITNDERDLGGSFDTSFRGLNDVMHTKSDEDPKSSSLVSVEYFNQIMTNFNRLLVTTKDHALGYFYLYENLNENMDYEYQASKDHLKTEVHKLSSVLPPASGFSHSERPLNLYKDQKFCWYFGLDTEEDKDQCANPDGFARFLGLLDSIPFSDTGSTSSESFSSTDSRYILKRRFDRGSFGEVWLAFQWNCSKCGDTMNQMHKDITCTANNMRLDPYELNMSAHANSSAKHCFADLGDDNLFILKRIMVEKGTIAYLSGLREKYFGEIFLNASTAVGGLASESLSSPFSMEAEYESSDVLLTNRSIPQELLFLSSSCNFTMPRSNYEDGLQHIARFVESFESQHREVWLVFQNEGLSLSKLIYTTEERKLGTVDERNEQISVLHTSAWWHWMRTTEAGKKEMRNLVRQLLMALKSCHERNITHRDIKPENMIICFEDVDTEKCLKRIPSGEKHYHLKMRIIDFGSALDEFSIKHLYGSGPTRSEQTLEYTPPEALLNATWFHGPEIVTSKYDMWSVGVVMMELILGTPNAFQISDRTRAMLDLHLEGWSQNMKELAYKLRSFMEMCILIPGQHHQRDRNKDHIGVWPASWKCSEESFSNLVKSRDPLRLGFPNIWALRLVRQLLLWHPEDRLSVDEALQHPYFQSNLQT